MSDDQITTKPFVSQRQAGWAFATHQPFARRWAKETGPYKKLPKRVKRRAKSYTLAEFSAIALKDGSDPVAVATAAMHTPELATLKAQRLAPGVSRIKGDLCNVHGRWGSCRAAGYGGAAPPSKRVAPKKLPAAPKPKAGGKRVAARGKKGGGAAPKKTEAQLAQERQAKRAAALQAKQQEQAQNRADTAAKLRSKPNAAAMEAMAALERGEPIDPDMAKALADETGLVDLHQDGSATLSPTGRAFLHALDRGDVAAAEDAQARAQDRQARTEERQTAADARQAAAVAKRAEAERLRAERLAKQKKGGGKGKKQPAPQAPARAPAPRSSTSPRPVLGGGGGGTRAAPEKKPAPQLAQALTDAAQALSEGQDIDDTTAAMLIRNGLAKRNRDGVLILTAAGQRATKKEATLKAAPTRTLDQGHTGVMVALYPDAKARQQIATTEGVTEPSDTLHLTLCYLGDSTEQPLATNKDRLIEAIGQWAAGHGGPLEGVVNGTGRFFHAEDDGTNAVYVSPDVPGLPELRQSLVEQIEASGFDYSQDHGFTPHITVAYVPLAAPTPPIHVETPIAFDRATLAWGDEQYDFPLGSNMAAQKAPSPGDYLVVEDPAKPSTWHLQVKRNGKPDHRLMGAAFAALTVGYRGNRYAGPNKAEALTKLKRLYVAEGMDVPSEKAALPDTALAITHLQQAMALHQEHLRNPDAVPSRASAEAEMRHLQAALLALGASGQREKSFAVFKDASGQYRWIARTTTAYRDRDGEIISEKALEDDAARMTATGVYGPLRYWHVGAPDPFDVDQPWGPGLDIGLCDFSTVIGRTSIESGTFKTEAIGRAFAASAADFELSPGFFHAPTEPDVRTGVFNHIRRFERSVVPTEHGRASNLFTGMTVKEHHMDQATYEQRVKTFLEFAREKGIPPEDAAAPIVALEQADKDAAARQIAYKEEKPESKSTLPKAFDFFRAFFTDEPPPQTTTKEETAPAAPAEIAPAASPPDLVASFKAELDALRAEIAALKAPVMAGDDETLTEDTAEGGMEEPGEGLTVSAEDLQAFATVCYEACLKACKEAMAPMAGMMDMEKKMAAHVQNALSSYTTQKDAGEAERANEVAALKATIDQQQAAITESQAKLTELLGDQPRGAGYRPSHAADNGAEQLLAAIKDGPDGAAPGPFDDIIANMFPGLAQGGIP